MEDGRFAIHIPPLEISDNIITINEIAVNPVTTKITSQQQWRLRVKGAVQESIVYVLRVSDDKIYISDESNRAIIGRWQKIENLEFLELISGSVTVNATESKQVKTPEQQVQDYKYDSNLTINNH